LISLDDILSADGRLLIMMSSTSHQEVTGFLPAGFRMEPAYSDPGIRVPLDIDTMIANEQWQAQLVTDDRAERDEAGMLFHYLRPTWVTRA
jgi:hypothetical protein